MITEEFRKDLSWFDSISLFQINKNFFCIRELYKLNKQDFS
jgi:hypothetical protein